MSIFSTTTIARFWSKVDVKKSETSCWPWMGATARGGYGRIKINGQFFTASRIVWEMHHGKELGEKFAMHTCDNPCCCNPYHIVLGDHKSNMRDMSEKGRANPPRHSHAGVLDWTRVRQIRRLFKTRLTNADIASRFDVSRHTISAIRNGRIWREPPDKRS